MAKRARHGHRGSHGGVFRLLDHVPQRCSLFRGHLGSIKPNSSSPIKMLSRPKVRYTMILYNHIIRYLLLTLRLTQRRSTPWLASILCWLRGSARSEIQSILRLAKPCGALRGLRKELCEALWLLGRLVGELGRCYHRRLKSLP